MFKTKIGLKYKSLDFFYKFSVTIKIMENLRELDDKDVICIIKNESLDEHIREEAREVIFERYDYMPKYILRKLRLKYKSYEEEDMIQQGYLLISKAIICYDYEKGCAFKSFLFFVLKKGHLSHYFQKNKYRFNELTLSDICEENDISTMDNLSKKTVELNSYDQLMLEDLLNKVKKNLTQSEYNCIMARYFGASYKDISKAFGYTLKQVDNKIQNIRKDKAKYIKIE